MPTIKIGKMSKKINSISRTFLAAPNGEMQVKLKEKTSMHDPVFIIQGLPKENDYNYCQWGSRYYWVNDKIFVTNDIQEFHCSLDCLATFHDSILGTTAYCSYADKDHWDPFMDDDRLTPDVEVPHNYHWTQYEDTLLAPFSAPNAPNNGFVYGTFILKTFACYEYEAEISGGMKCYAIPPNEIQRLFLSLRSNIDAWVQDSGGSFLDDIGELIGRAWTGWTTGADPKDSLISLMFVPIHIDYFPGNSVNNVYIGPFKYDVTGWGVKENPTIATFFSYIGQQDYWTINIPWHPITTEFPFLRDPKYTSLAMRTVDGEIDINDYTLVNQPACVFRFGVDFNTGRYTYQFQETSEPNSKILGQVDGQLGVDMSWMQNIATEPSFNSWMGNMFNGTVKAVSNIAMNTLMPSQGVRTVISSDRNWSQSSSLQAGLYQANYQEAGTIEGGSTTTTNKYMNTSGISGCFGGGNKQSPTTASPSMGNSTLKSLIIDKDPNNKYRQIWSLTVYSKFPNIFMRKDANNNWYADGTGYTQFCDEYGWPCHKRLMLSEIFDDDNPTHTSYVKCEAASWTPTSSDVGATQDDISFINSSLNTGIFLER